MIMSTYSTTRDRAMTAAADAEHLETYGTPVPRTARRFALRFVALVVGIVAAVFVFVPMIGHAEDVRHCQTVHAAGASDSAEAVRCEAVLFGK
jgi:hypothetical protein